MCMPVYVCMSVSLSICLPNADHLFPITHPSTTFKIRYPPIPAYSNFYPYQSNFLHTTEIVFTQQITCTTKFVNPLSILKYRCTPHYVLTGCNS